MNIDLYVESLQEVVDWEHIAKVLRHRNLDVAFVAEPPNPADASPGLSADGYEEIRDYLTRNRLPYLAQPRHEDADAVVSGGAHDRVRLYRGIKLRMTEGWRATGDDPIEDASFDAVLVNSPYQTRDAGDRRVVCGYPKLAPLLRGELSRERCARQFGLRPNQRTVVYLTAHGVASSLDRFRDVVAALGRQYNVIHKPHPLSIRDEPQRFESLRRSPDVLVDLCERNTAPFLAVADVVLADIASSSLMESLLAQTTTIALAPSASPVAELLPGLEDAIPVCSEPTALGRLVDELLLEDPFRAARQRLGRELFIDFDGRDDELAAQSIIGLVERERERQLVGA